MIRFLRVLTEALRLTLRGETLTPARYRPLEVWIARGLELLQQVERTTAAQRVDPAALQLKLDGRPTSLERTLQMVRHNLVNDDGDKRQQYERPIPRRSVPGGGSDPCRDTLAAGGARRPLASPAAASAG